MSFMLLDAASRLGMIITRGPQDSSFTSNPHKIVALESHSFHLGPTILASTIEDSRALLEETFNLCRLSTPNWASFFRKRALPKETVMEPHELQRIVHQLGCLNFRMT